MPSPIPVDHFDETRAAGYEPTEIKALIVRGGFHAPVLISQSLLIHAWAARRAG